VRPGSVVRIDLVALNPGFAEEMRLDPRPTLDATFAS
jgi:hypothetical protein